MNTIPFKQLPIGSTFRFASETALGWQGARGPWIKISLRRYRHEHQGIEATVGTWNAPVIEVAPAVPVQSEPTPEPCTTCGPQDATFTGYDGSTYRVGDRVELHPALDRWMRGDRYGDVDHVLRDGRVQVKTDHGATLKAFPHQFRAI